MKLLIALIVWIGAVGGAVEVSTLVADSIHNTPTGTAAGAGSGSRSGGTPFDASSVKSTDPQSLFRTANFSRALATARARLGAGAQLDNLALYPGYLVLTAVKANSEIDLYIAANGSYTENDTGGNPGASGLFGLARVQADTPATLAQRIATSGHVPDSQLNYMVVDVDPASNKVQWLVYPLEGNRVEYFQAPSAAGPLSEYRTNSATGLQPVAE